MRENKEEEYAEKCPVDSPPLSGGTTREVLYERYRKGTARQGAISSKV